MFFILGGGPSLRGFDVERLRGRGRIIAVNDAGLDLCSWADVLFFADRRWYDWNRERLDEFRGGAIWTRKAVPDTRVTWPGSYIGRRLSHWPNALGGVCGGANAINLAYLMGAKVIVLLGFDMRITRPHRSPVNGAKNSFRRSNPGSPS